MTVTSQVKEAEDDIGARVRRLHGTQTEEEIAAEAAKTRPDAPGSIGAILAAAKNKIAETKKEMTNQDIDKQAKAVTQDEVNDRMAALRAKMNGGGDNSVAASDMPERKSNVGGGLGEIIEHAREISHET
ncbi:hypothetical protein Zmor_011946 [Zophobas morio]|uniref:Uncharacterized protein n=1 Tax=Zophobas morio TaxID=2755281 RepID=A0AA38HG48_9CUCU|nr:hypothetical protein Zmor_011946 [Zophobas morio]